MDSETRLAAAEKEEKIKEPVKIRNKDIPLLADVLCIMQEIRQLEERREWQQGRLYNITQHLTGMPGGGNPAGMDGVFAILSEIDEEHKQRCEEYVRQIKKAQKILNSIETRSMRTFVLMKYVMDTPDTEIRKELNMTRRGFDRARKAVETAPCMAAVKWQERYILIK